MLIVFKDIKDLHKLENLLNIEFVMKDLDLTKRILGIDIRRNRDKGLLALFQFGYIKKVVELYNMMNMKSVNIPMRTHFKLKFVLSELSFEET